ncbi:hypothetical protein MKW98_024172 [Papaver atlanticum]|uniref:Glycosyltransferase 61 catalytic domain-containing protein n=1 Tax=Papaver atlanticum TaxID=357466 RepID=A0AAD4SZR7_9MAGN|nr:hypothetical protein MKW98_024172 [Papaver atlanticum]
MSRRKAFLLKLLVYLFFLNSISFFIYLSHYKSEKNPSFIIENHTKLPLLEEEKKKNFSFVKGKPWPILPSYSPWNLNPNVRVQSCEGYFGSGFNKKIDLLIRSPEIHTSANYGGGGGGGGWFRCFYSETLDSSICEGGRVRMNIDRISMSVGGENLELVIGRGEEEELPTFEPGSFEIEAGNDQRVNGNELVSQEFLDQFVPEGVVVRHTMRSLLDSIRLVNSEEFKCSQWVEEPILLVTRFEYANLFHTVTDWYSAYAASRVTGVPIRPHLVFLDGHCKSQLEETWSALFSSLRYAKNFSGSVCFRHVILSPLGYETALFKGLTEVINCRGAEAHSLWQNPNDLKTARLTEFGEMIRASFGLPLEEIRVQKSQVPRHNVLFVRREDYLAHPRHDGRVESRLSNEQEVFDSLKVWIDNNSFGCEVNLVNGLFAHMHMKEQVRAIQDASVIIGAHGAGLTHIVAATSKAIILEIISSYFRRPHFALISQWRGLEYHAINLDGSSADPDVVIGHLRQILGSLGC